MRAKVRASCSCSCGVSGRDGGRRDGMADCGAVVGSFATADEPGFRAGVDLVVELDGVVAGGGGAGVPSAGMSEG